MPTFPAFLTLENSRPPLVVGANALAAAKVRMLLPYAPAIDVMTAGDRSHIITAIDPNHKINVSDHAPDVHAIQGRPLVIAATGDPLEDARISAIAHAIGVPVNVPDNRDLSSFFLGAIVDRHPLTIAIGTNGTAPTLATRLRARLEMELEPDLGQLAKLADRYRADVARHIPAGAPRRDFWERVFTGPPARAVRAGRPEEAAKLLEDSLKSQAAPTAEGRVILVGAGPGDPDLITVKGLRAIKSADVILHDYLAAPELLDYARAEAELVCVGKARGRHSRTQAEINALILHHVRKGRVVVRLKGGDPFLFGRGGEEVDILRASGIPVEVVPGITAATAAAATTQIPLTHRDLGRTVTFMSGHAAGNGEADYSHINFASMAGVPNTLVVYMGAATCDKLATQLLAAGWSPTTPVLAIERASMTSERRVATTLDVMANENPRLALKAPALLIVGEVAGLTPDGKVERVHTSSPHHIEVSSYA